MPFFDTPGPLVFAHRGGSALGPENTIAAFDAGMRAGADGLELDVHLSADGIVVVHHDETLDRTTNGSGPIAARTAAELARLDAGRGEGVPTLREVLARYDVPTIIEIKVNSEAAGLAVLDEVQRANAVERVCAGGFGLRALQAIRAAEPRLATSAAQFEARMEVYRGWIGWPPQGVPYGGFQIPEMAEGIRVVSPRFIERAHRRGLKVQVWTVDDEDDMRRLLEWGVDGLITNRPDAAVRVRDAFVAARQPARA